MIDLGVLVEQEVRLSKIDFSKILGMVAHFQRRWTVEVLSTCGFAALNF